MSFWKAIFLEVVVKFLTKLLTKKKKGASHG